MYTYPSGLKCDVPKWRVSAFEAIMPILTVGIIFAGLPLVSTVIGDKQDLLWSLAVVPWVWMAWVVLWSALFCLLFRIWCKPVAEPEKESLGPVSF